MKYIFMLLLSISVLFSKALVYEISDEKGKFYIGGTIHVLRATDYPLPLEYNKVFNKSNIIVFETDIEKLDSFSSQREFLKSMSYKDSKNLENYLSQGSIDQLKLYCKNNNLSYKSMKKFKVSLAVLNIMMNEMQKVGVSGNGIDKHYFVMAKEKNKKISYLESVQKQIKILSSMGEGKEDAYLIESLKEAYSLNEDIVKLIKAFKNADVKVLEEFLLADSIVDDKKMYKDLIIDRNKAWVEKLVIYTTNSDIEFVLVGAMHLIGKDSILLMLKNKGFKVKQVKF